MNGISMTSSVRPRVSRFYCIKPRSALAHPHRSAHLDEMTQSIRSPAGAPRGSEARQMPGKTRSPTRSSHESMGWSEPQPLLTIAVRTVLKAV